MPPAKIILKYGFVYLLAIHPVLSLFSHNADEVQFYELLVPVGLVLVVTMLMHVVLLATLGSHYWHSLKARFARPDTGEPSDSPPTP